MKRKNDVSAPVSWRLALHVIALACLLLGTGALGQVPDEVDDLSWCNGSKECLTWSAVENTTGYKVYRGNATTLPGVLDGTIDSCTVGSFASTTTGPQVDDPVPTGTIQWFLVTALSPFGEGGAGQATEGSRVLDSSGDCVSGVDLVINEVDYDQAGTDSGEFIEIHNAGTTERALASLVLILVNGLSSSEYARVELSDAGASLAAGAYLVIGSSAVVQTLPPGTPSVVFPSSTNNIQNGAPDGVALFDTATVTLVDALSYEGSITAAQFDGIPGTYNLVEGTAATAQDSNSVDGSLIRFPDGTDTADADADWRFSEILTPGTTNSEP